MFGLSFMAAIIESIQKYTASRKMILVRKSASRFFTTEPSSFNNLEIYTGDVRLKMLIKRGPDCETSDQTNDEIRHLLTVPTTGK